MNNEPPFHQPEPLPAPPQKVSDRTADAPLRNIMLIISLISLGIALVSAAYVSAQWLFFHDERITQNIWSIGITIGLAYIVGWTVSLIGIRLYQNLILPILIEIYAWATLVGISVLYIAILNKLYKQGYQSSSFIKYALLMSVTIAGLIGLHLLIEKHSLRLFSIPLLLICLGHLYLIVYHYVFVLDVKYDYLHWDILFFLGMTTISILMLLHVGVLSGARNTISGLFEKNHSENTQPQN